jgi:protoporphyrinogen oxidase
MAGQIAGQKSEIAPRSTRNLCQEHNEICGEGGVYSTGSKRHFDVISRDDVVLNVSIPAAMKLLKMWIESINLEKLMSTVYSMDSLVGVAMLFT